MQLMLKTLALFTAFVDAAEDPTLSDLLAGPNFTVLSGLVRNASLEAALTDVTLFAPTDAAFTKLAPEIVEKVLKFKSEDIASVLKAHIVKGKQNSTKLLKNSPISTEFGKVNVREVDGKVKVDESVVTKANIMAKDGIVHEIDYVIIPAFDKLQTNVVEVAAQGGNPMRTLSQLLIAGNLTSALTDETKKFSVFAPTDEAFTKCIDTRLTNELLKPKNIEFLQKLLLFHVVAEENALSGEPVTTLQGGNITVVEKDKKYEVRVENKTKAVIVDSINVPPQRNSVIYAIDSCLMPPGVDFNSLLGSDDSGLSTNYIILIVLGVLAFLIIVAAIVAMAMRKRRSNGYAAADDEEGGYGMAQS